MKGVRVPSTSATLYCSLPPCAIFLQLRTSEAKMVETEVRHKGEVDIARTAREQELQAKIQQCEARIKEQRLSEQELKKQLQEKEEFYQRNLALAQEEMTAKLKLQEKQLRHESEGTGAGMKIPGSDVHLLEWRAAEKRYREQGLEIRRLQVCVHVNLRAAMPVFELDLAS